MLSMTDETRAFLAERCSDIPQDREHLNDLLDFLDALMLDSAYIDYKSQDYVTFNYSSPSLIQRIGLKKTAVEVAVFCVGAAIVAYAVLGRKKKERKDR